MPLSYTVPDSGRGRRGASFGRRYANQAGSSYGRRAADLNPRYDPVRRGFGDNPSGGTMVKPPYPGGSLGGAGLRPTAAQLRAAATTRVAPVPAPIQQAGQTLGSEAASRAPVVYNPNLSGTGVVNDNVTGPGGPLANDPRLGGFHSRYQDASLPMLFQHPEAILADVMQALGQNPNGAQYGMEAPYAPLAQSLYMASGAPAGGATDQADWYAKFFAGLSGPAGSNLNTSDMIRNILTAGGGKGSPIFNLIAGLKDPAAQVDAVNSLLQAVMNYGIGPIMQQSLTNNMNQMERDYYRQRAAVGAPTGAGSGEDYYNFLRQRQNSAMINAFA